MMLGKSSIFVSISLSSGFSFQARQACKALAGGLAIVSISLSSGFSFQAPATPVDSAVQVLYGFNLVIERLLISGCRRRHPRPRRRRRCRFNLVIERLLISGCASGDVTYQIGIRCFNLVIERLLISGYCVHYGYRVDYDCFNLVIERLLISGQRTWFFKLGAGRVSISLSSGFSFQVLM